MAARSAMAKLVWLLALLVLICCSSFPGGAECRKWKKKIRVYNYLSIQGPNSSAGYNTVQCGAAIPLAQPRSFGQTYCFDMPLLKSRSLDPSQLLGRVQGTFVFVSQSAGEIDSVNTIFVAETFSLNASGLPRGTFTGTGLEQVGRVSSKPLTGGTADFALATGVATTTPLSNGTDSFGNYGSWFRYDFAFHNL